MIEGQSLNDNPSISVVTSLYYSAPHIEEFCHRMRFELEKYTHDYQMIFVNDGSPDNSLEVILRIQQSEQRIEVIDLSRNFGHHKALMTGLGYAKKNLVFLIDVDLEEVPELLTPLYRAMKETGAEMAYGVQQKRKGKIGERFSGWLFYKVLSLLSNIKIPENVLMARLMTQQFVRDLVSFREHELFLNGIMASVGYRQQAVVVPKGSKGTTTYSWKRRWKLALNGITSFSDRPLILTFLFGIIITLTSFCALAVLCIRWYLEGAELGWTSLICSIFLSTGLIIFCVGIISLYLSKIFVEVKNRPYSIVRNHFMAREAIEHSKVRLTSPRTS